MTLPDAPFTAFSTSHWAALAATVSVAAGLVWLLRSAAAESRKDLARRAMAVLLVASAVGDPLIMPLRYGAQAGLAYAVQDGLPLHLCDWAAVVLAIGFWRKSWRAAELGWVWGFSGTLQGLITPALAFDAPAPEYFGFFLQHAGVPAAAVGLVFGGRLYPRPGALWRALRWSWVYMGSAIALDWLLGANYGFLLRKPDTASLFDHLGPWPYYLLSLQLVGLVSFSLWLGAARLARWLLRENRNPAA